MDKKQKGNLRLQKVYTRLYKTRYTNLTPIEKKFIKLNEAVDQFDKDLYGLNGFYATCKRTINNAVDFDNMTQQELDYFDYIYKSHQKAIKSLNNFIEKNKITEEKELQIYKNFKQNNNNSVSCGG